MAAFTLDAQVVRAPGLVAPPPPAPATPQQPDQRVRVPRPNAPPPGEWIAKGVEQTAEGPVYHLKGKAELESSAMLFRADDMTYNEDTGDLRANGNIYYHNFERNEEIWADRLEYNTQEERGTFYHVRGTGNTRIDARPGVLTTTNPIYFEGEWAERVGDKYILHKGLVTNCKMPSPWWTLRGPKFDIVPDDRAIAYRSVLRLRKVPILYAPAFYKSLEKAPRRSGFLTPNIGNSSTRGKMVGVGYFWAINRSYDATYRVQDFTERGFAHHVEFRGKPGARSDFDAILYGVQDRGLELGNGQVLKQGGASITVKGKSDLSHGWQARGEVNYLSSLEFRQAFTETFNEAIFSENHTVVFLNKNWSNYTFNAVFARLENFLSTQPGDSVVIRKLPEFEFAQRDERVVKDFPLWFSFQSAAGLLRRTQPLFQTRQFTERLDVRPRVMTALRWKEWNLIPSFSLAETHYGEQQENGRITGGNINRDAREFTIDLIAPSLARVFNRKTFLGEKLKHVIEPRASYRYVTGVEDFNNIVRFDETDLLSNTNEVEISLTNRLYAKRSGVVSEIFSWELWQKRYFDPTFGGAVVPGRRNVVDSQVELTPYAFLDRPRSTSPVVSVLRASPKPGFGIEWRADYDASRGGIVNSGVTADVRLARYFVSAGHNQVHCTALIAGQDCRDPATARLSPPANQFRGLVGFGNENRRGWNAAFTAIYDYRIGVMQYATTQVTYNTDCCGWSVQYRRFNFGTRNDNQFRLAFAIANIGSFGTLKKQERLF